MSDLEDGPATAVAMLEQARAELESVLRADAHWPSLAKATLPAHRAALERALADNAVFHAWRLVGQAIAELQAGGAAAPAPAADTDRTSASAPRSPRGTRLELRQVLERIRSQSPFDTVAPTTSAPAASHAGNGPPSAGPVIAPADIEIEEAAVSFIVRRAAGEVPAPQSAEAADELRGGQAVDGPPEAAEPGDGVDTEVTIVPRRA